MLPVSFQFQDDHLMVGEGREKRDSSKKEEVRFSEIERRGEIEMDGYIFVVIN